MYSHSASTEGLPFTSILIVFFIRNILLDFDSANYTVSDFPLCSMPDCLKALSAVACSSDGFSILCNQSCDRSTILISSHTLQAALELLHSGQHYEPMRSAFEQILVTDAYSHANFQDPLCSTGPLYEPVVISIWQSP